MEFDEFAAVYDVALDEAREEDVREIYDALAVLNTRTAEDRFDGVEPRAVSRASDAVTALGQYAAGMSQSAYMAAERELAEETSAISYQNEDRIPAEILEKGAAGVRTMYTRIVDTVYVPSIRSMWGTQRGTETLTAAWEMDDNLQDALEHVRDDRTLDLATREAADEVYRELHPNPPISPVDRRRDRLDPDA